MVPIEEYEDEIGRKCDRIPESLALHRKLLYNDLCMWLGDSSFYKEEPEAHAIQKSYFYNGNWAMQKVIHWTRSQSLYESRVLH